MLLTSKDGDDPRNACLIILKVMNEHVITIRMITIFNVDEPDILEYRNSYYNTAINTKILKLIPDSVHSNK